MNLAGIIILSVVGTGISSIAVQIITIREFLTQFSGNEITISLVLFCWLVISGIGSLASRSIKSSLFMYSVLALVTGIFPLAQIIAIRILRDVIFIHGESPGLYPTFFFILGLSAIYTFMIGLILPYSLGVIRQDKRDLTTGGLYITDNIGDIGGGILTSFILVYFFTPFKVIALTSSLLLFISLVLLIYLKRYVLFLAAFICVVVFFGASFEKGFEIRTLYNQYGPNILSYQESPFGRIVLTEENGEYTFWESGMPIYSTSNIIDAEEKVHYPLCQLEKVEDVLLVSGGMGETLDEILKYSPNSVDYVELDPALTKIAARFGILRKKAGVSIITADGRKYIANTDKKYSAVILDLPEPDNFQINRFYTGQFFAQAKGALKKHGILSFSLIANPNYLSEVRIKKLSSIYNALKNSFSRVLLIPGEEIYFLASDGELTPDVPIRLKEKSIPTSYIEGYYYGNVTEDRIRSINKCMDPEEFSNMDFQPRVLNIMFKEWFKKYGTSPGLFMAVLLALLAFYLFIIRREEYVLFSTGFATMGTEILVLISFQVIYGYVYLKVGLIITAFLSGLLPGAILGNRWKKGRKRVLIKTEAWMILLLLAALLWISFSQHILPEKVFFLYGLFFSVLCGIQFPVAAEMIGEHKSPAANLFAADLVGAGSGTLVIGVLSIPLWGIHAAIIILILVKLISAIVVLRG